MAETRVVYRYKNFKDNTTKDLCFICAMKLATNCNIEEEKDVIQ